MYMLIVCVIISSSSLLGVGLPKNHIDDAAEAAPRLRIEEYPLLSCFTWDSPTFC